MKSKCHICRCLHDKKTMVATMMGVLVCQRCAMSIMNPVPHRKWPNLEPPHWTKLELSKLPSLVRKVAVKVMNMRKAKKIKTKKPMPKSANANPKVKEYVERMSKEGRCEQCVHPWYDGLCECGKWGDEQEEMEIFMSCLLSTGKRKL